MSMGVARGEVYSGTDFVKRPSDVQRLAVVIASDDSVRRNIIAFDEPLSDENEPLISADRSAHARARR